MYFPYKHIHRDGPSLKLGRFVRAVFSTLFSWGKYSFEAHPTGRETASHLFVAISGIAKHKFAYVKRDCFHSSPIQMALIKDPGSLHIGMLMTPFP